jgi:hypothetical protein
VRKKPSNQSRERKGDRYLWYWKPPFNVPNSGHFFNRNHWWRPPLKDTPHDAALYELLRRHPIVGDCARRTLRLGGEFPTEVHDERILALSGPVPRTEDLGPDPATSVAWEMVLNGYYLRPWNDLSKEEKANFEKNIRTGYPGKGRNLTKGVFDLTEEAKEIAKREKDVGISFEQILQELATSSASRGQLVLAIDTDFSSMGEVDAAFAQLTTIFKQHWQKPTDSVRARIDDWLGVIEEFENESALEKNVKFKLGNPPIFKQFKALFEDSRIHQLRNWWRKGGSKEWAKTVRAGAKFNAEFNSRQKSLQLKASKGGSLT